ncbi:hypothetical protein C8F04DRAFT_1226909 [Mycena alexandri]|uniref:B-related factor 1 n=1 Tax=Mycena alexandri TaxID=1745969 RepID=A0AAD6TM06_9AGAR|nr:hypothetical protein C8F04DRAFT_1226909 [Mycena alexandri]
MPPPCKHCGQPTVVDDIGVVCIACAELQHPKQVVLTSDIDYPHSTTFDGFSQLAPKTLKTGRNRFLTGHGKEVRDSKNFDEMQYFIRDLTRAAFVSGVSERAYNLFEKAMRAGPYRWGRTARLVAGACISIALRQSNRPDMFADLANLLEQKVVFLTRAFSSVITVLELNHTEVRDVPRSEPKTHVSALQAHLSAALQDSAESDLPASLIAVIRPLSTNAIVATATSLSELLASSTPPTTLSRLPTSSTACAVLIWAIEAEARTALTQLSELAKFLGSKCNMTKAVVMSRYKLVQDALIERIDKIDYLDHYELKGGKGGRAKLPRRLVVARGLKAVIEHERRCRREDFVAPRPKAGTDPNAEDGDSDSERPRKRRRVHALEEATRFLLNPLIGPLPVSFRSSSRAAMPLPTFLLTSSLSMRTDKLPSRLQLLCATRGGVGPDEILDDELFDNGELEKMMRTDEEVTELRRVLEWPEGCDAEPEPAKPPPKPRKRAGGAKADNGISVRINNDALNAFFGADDKSDELEGLLVFEDTVSLLDKDGNDTDPFIGLPKTLVASAVPGEEKEDDDDDDDDDHPFHSPGPDEQYAQEI